MTVGFGMTGRNSSLFLIFNKASRLLRKRVVIFPKVCILTYTGNRIKLLHPALK